MTAGDIEVVSAIHSAVLPTVTARSGFAVLRVFYSTLLQTPEQQCAYVAEQGGIVIGAITGTLDSHTTSRTLSRTLLHPQVFFSALRALALGTMRVSEVIERKRTEDALHALTPPPYSTILTLVVSKQAQNIGVGTALLTKIERVFPRHTNLHVDTETKNVIAQRFYERNGYTKRFTIRGSILYAKQLP